MMTYDGWAAACLGEEDELDKLRDALREDIETLGVIADRLALGSRGAQSQAARSRRRCRNRPHIRSSSHVSVRRQKVSAPDLIVLCVVIFALGVSVGQWSLR
jgi:hypothetical protein